MKETVIKFINLILALFLAVFSISYVFAWFADGTKVPLSLSGQAAAYFAGGDGLSEETAFVINDPVHLYNLSWLQNNGRLDDLTYYFEIDEKITSLDMSGYWLAPIGNYDHPFKGIFNGNGKTITGLQVTTNKSLLQSNDPARVSTYLFSNAVGFFGKTNVDAEIRNFILDNPKVEVEAGDSNYFTASSTQSDERVVGFAVGEDNGSATSTDGTTTAAISNIGVIGGILSVQRTGYTTKNAIIGSTALRGTTDSGSGSRGNTGYFDPSYIYEQVVATTGNPIVPAYNSIFLYYNDAAHFNANLWIVAEETNNNALGALGLGSFSIVTSPTYNTSSNSLIGARSRNLSHIYQYVTIAGNTEKTNDQIKAEIVPENGWKDATSDTTKVLTHYYRSGADSAIYSGSASVYTEDGDSQNMAKSVYHDRSIKVDISLNNLQETASLLMLVTNNNSNTEDERNIFLNKYIAVNSSNQEIQYSNYSSLQSESLDTGFGTNGQIEFSITGTNDDQISVIYYEFEKSGTYGITFEGSIRVYFMRVVGAAGTVPDPIEGNLENIDFIPTGLTMSATGTLSPTWSGTGTLIQITGTGASIIMGFSATGTNSSDGNTCTYQSLTVTYYVTTSTGVVAYAPQSSVGTGGDTGVTISSVAQNEFAGDFPNSIAEITTTSSET